MSVMLCPCIFCVSLLVYLFVLCVACLTVFVNCLVKYFAMCLGVVAEYYGCVQCGWRCSVGYTVYGLPRSVCVVPVIPVCI